MAAKSDPDKIISCEYVFWHGNATSVLFPAEPAASGSGLILCLFALFGPPWHVKQLPLEFWLANASLFACGIGTFLFHAFDRQDNVDYGINPNIWDYVTMAMVVSNTSLLYMEKWMKPVGAYIVVLYLLFAAYSNDTLSYKYLWDHTNGSISMWVQYPAFIIPYVCMFVYVVGYYYDTYVLIISVGVGGLAWCIDRFLCDGVSALAFGHTIWHVAIGYVSILFMCYGLRKRGIQLTGAWWPSGSDYDL